MLCRIMLILEYIGLSPLTIRCLFETYISLYKKQPCDYFLNNCKERIYHNHHPTNVTIASDTYAVHKNT